mmetsp:Transcript_4379/g.8067  ORF Transcript_4379/g.8067 Transcript_4379/m.8067 type:complete len:437 (-) Transcript_4379:142-1452(-)
MKLHSPIHPVADVVNKVVEVVDMDGIVRRISVDDVVKRIDVNDVVQRVDWNEVLSNIDWDSQLERINLDSVIRKIDTNSILVRSSTGAFTNFLDALRTQVVLVDLYLRIVTRCRFWRRHHRQRCYLPPRPGEDDVYDNEGYNGTAYGTSYQNLGYLQQQESRHVVYPKGRANKAVAVQGRYCGFLSKAIAILIDNLSITILFAFLFRLIEWGLILFLGATSEDASQKIDTIRSKGSFWILMLYGLFWFSYFFLTVGLAGQTLGMMVVGLRVCNHSRKSRFYDNPHILTVTMGQAFVRTCLLPLTLTVFPPLGLFGPLRRDGRMLHDWIANTGLVYLWDAKMAKIRRKVVHDVEYGDAISTSTGSDGSDELDRILVDDSTTSGTTSFHSSGTSHVGQEVILGRSSTSSSGDYTIPRQNGDQNDGLRMRTSSYCCGIQ